VLTSSMQQPLPGAVSIEERIETVSPSDSDSTGVPDRAELPIPEYDHLPIGSLQGRIRSLPEADLVTLLRYEQAHADRLPAVLAMQTRLEELRAGAQPSGGDPAAAQPEAAGSAGGASGVNPQTAGPTPDVDFQGVPGEPRRPHSGRSAASK
jgi:hypothetical protein